MRLKLTYWRLRFLLKFPRLKDIELNFITLALGHSAWNATGQVTQKEANQDLRDRLVDKERSSTKRGNIKTQNPLKYIIRSQGGKVVGSWISIPATRVRLPPGYLPQKKTIKTAQCAFHNDYRSLKAYLKIIKKKILVSGQCFKKRDQWDTNYAFVENAEFYTQQADQENLTFGSA